MCNDFFNPTWETTECILCDVIANEPWVPYKSLFPNSENNSQILLETHSFVVIPDIAPIFEGYCLIVSKRHVPSMAYLWKNELIELDTLQNCLKSTINSFYGNVVIFEHGEISFSQNAGACIDHAHLHFVPTNYDVDFSSSHITFKKTNKIERWKNLHSNNAYLYYENQDGDCYYSYTNQCEQQFFRKRIAKQITPNYPWNWREYIKLASVYPTKEKIANCIYKIGSKLQNNWNGL